MAADGLVLKHQAISTHSAYIVLVQFNTKNTFIINNIKKIKSHFENKYSSI